MIKMADILNESISQAYEMQMCKSELIDFLVEDKSTAYLGRKMITEYINREWED